MKFHDRPDMQMRLAEGDEITAEGMLAAKCAHLPWHTLLRFDCSEVLTKVFCLTKEHTASLSQKPSIKLMNLNNRVLQMQSAPGAHF